jgi:hypothetical protein
MDAVARIFDSAISNSKKISKLTCHKKFNILEAVPKLQFWNSNLRFNGKSGL